MFIHPIRNYPSSVETWCSSSLELEVANSSEAIEESSVVSSRCRFVVDSGAIDS